MKKLLLSLGLMASLASAKDMTGRFGIGGSTTLGGTNGITAMYQLSKTLTVDGTFGFDINDGDMAWRLAGHAMVNFADFDNANLLLGGGLNINSTPDQDHTIGMSIDLPIRPQYFFNDRFSVYTEVGLNIDFMQPGNDTPAEDHESETSISLNSQVLGSAGVVFYF